MKRQPAAYSDQQGTQESPLQFQLEMEEADTNWNRRLENL